MYTVATWRVQRGKCVWDGARLKQMKAQVYAKKKKRIINAAEGAKAADPSLDASTYMVW